MAKIPIKIGEITHEIEDSVLKTQLGSDWVFQSKAEHEEVLNNSYISRFGQEKGKLKNEHYKPIDEMLKPFGHRPDGVDTVTFLKENFNKLVEVQKKYKEFEGSGKFDLDEGKIRGEEKAAAKLIFDKLEVEKNTLLNQIKTGKNERNIQNALNGVLKDVNKDLYPEEVLTTIVNGATVGLIDMDIREFKGALTIYENDQPKIGVDLKTVTLEKHIKDNLPDIIFKKKEGDGGNGTGASVGGDPITGLPEGIKDENDIIPHIHKLGLKPQFGEGLKLYQELIKKFETQ